MSYGDEAILLQLAATSVLYPKKDWREIDPLHAQMVTFRAIENGFSVVSQAVGGLSVAVDDEANVLASTDFFTTDPQVMVAYVPVQGVHTIYTLPPRFYAEGCCSQGPLQLRTQRLVALKREKFLSQQLPVHSDQTSRYHGGISPPVY